MKDNYDDIINLPHYEPKYHKRMPRLQRAAQFAPYAALTGYGDEVSEAGRSTVKKKILSEDEKNKIDLKLEIAMSDLYKDSPITVTYFKKDKTKDGGLYLKYSGTIKRINDTDRKIIFRDKKEINIDDILDIESEYLNI